MAGCLQGARAASAALESLALTTACPHPFGLAPAFPSPQVPRVNGRSATALYTPGKRAPPAVRAAISMDTIRTGKKGRPAERLENPLRVSLMCTE